MENIVASNGKRNITLLVMYFPPEIGSASHLFFELAKELIRMNYDVTVVTTFPRKFNLNKDDLPSLSKYKWKLLFIENIEGIKVIRLPNLPVPRDAYFLRGIEHFYVPVPIAIGGLFTKSDIIIVYSPPLPLGFAGWALGKVKNASVIVNIQDLYPQAAIDIGLIKNRLLIKIFKLLETSLYGISDHITVHSEGNKEYIKQYLPDDKITVIPNWYNGDIKLLDKHNGLRASLNLNGEFVVTYAGIMSYSQDIGTIVDAAALLKDRKNIKFIIAGDGPQKKEIEEKVKSKTPDNVIILPFQPKEKYSTLLAASDICLVTLDSTKVKTPVVPRKLGDIMIAHRAVVANVPEDGDVPKIIENANCGICVEPNHPEKLAEAILALNNNRAQTEEFGANGYNYAISHFAINACCGQYEKLFDQLIHQPGTTTPNTPGAMTSNTSTNMKTKT